MFIPLKAFADPQRGGALLLAAAAFAAGLGSGALLLASGAAKRSGGGAAGWRTGRCCSAAQWPSGRGVARHRQRYLRCARAPLAGHGITTRVRLRGIDAPELHARCDGERVKALAARDALAPVLAEGSVGISRVGRTNMAAASMPTCRRRCSPAAMRAATTVAGARAGMANAGPPPACRHRPGDRARGCRHCTCGYSRVRRSRRSAPDDWCHGWHIRRRAA